MPKRLLQGVGSTVFNKLMEILLSSQYEIYIEAKRQTITYNIIKAASYTIILDEIIKYFKSK